MARFLHFPYSPHKGREMEMRQIISKAAERELEETLEAMFALRMNGEDYEREYRIVRRRTEELLYLMPSRHLHLSEEHAASVYLSLYERIDHIIFSFRISRGVAYMDYLKGVLKLRISHVMRCGEENRVREDGHLRGSHDDYQMECYSCEPAYLVERFEEEPYERRLFYGEAEERPLCACHSLKECFSLILAHEPRPRLFDKASMQELYDHLSHFRNRRNMLFLLLMSRQRLDALLVGHLATLFDVDESLMAVFDRFRQEERRDEIRYEEEAGIRNHHWLRYIALSNSYEKEGDGQRKAELGRLLESCRRRLEAKCLAVRSLGHGITVRRLEEILGIPSSTISFGARQARADLERIASIR